jgi:hypothetical protein
MPVQHKRSSQHLEQAAVAGRQHLHSRHRRLPR